MVCVIVSGSERKPKNKTVEREEERRGEKERKCECKNEKYRAGIVVLVAYISDRKTRQWFLYMRVCRIYLPKRF